MWIKMICLVFVLAVVVEASGPEKKFSFSSLQRELLQSHNKGVLPPEERDKAERHFFRLKTLSFDKHGDVHKQIEAYEQKNRLGYDEGPFYVHDETGKEGKDSGWEKWFREAFTIEPDWANGLTVPYFCRVLTLSDERGKTIHFEDLSRTDWRNRSKAAVRAILQPLSARPANQLSKVPIYVVQYRGNSEGNCKFVKLYIGKEDAADFLVFDVSVYDHF